MKCPNCDKDVKIRVEDNVEIALCYDCGFEKRIN